MNGKLQTFTRLDKPDDPIPPGHHGDTRERYENDEYLVFIDKYVQLWEVTVLRRDRGTVHDWRDLQAIKTTLVGPEFEGFELYPAESRVIDVANEAHIFVLMTNDNKPIRINYGRAGVRKVSDTLSSGQGQRLLGK